MRDGSRLNDWRVPGRDVWLLLLLLLQGSSFRQRRGRPRHCTPGGESTRHAHAWEQLEWAWMTRSRLTVRSIGSCVFPGRPSAASVCRHWLLPSPAAARPAVTALGEARRGKGSEGRGSKGRDGGEGLSDQAPCRSAAPSLATRTLVVPHPAAALRQLACLLAHHCAAS